MTSRAPARRGRVRSQAAFGAFCLAALAALTWPGYAWLGNRIEPRLLGLPFSLFWIVAWIAASFAALCALERARRP